MGNQPRYLFIDYLRSISIVYIVGYLHLLNYTNVYPGYFNYFTYLITMIALGLLVFISGYLIGIKKDDFNFRSSIIFLYRRFIRIYPPFVISTFLFCLLGIIDRNSGLKASLLISGFLTPTPITLWFIPMICFFYFIAPILCNTSHNKLLYLALCISIIFILVVYSLSTNLLDKRVLLYLPPFLTGLFFGRNNPSLLDVSVTNLLFLLPLTLILGFVIDSKPNLSNYFMSPFVTVLSTLIFVSMASLIKNNTNSIISCIITELSYASYFMYLLHRPVYTLLLELWSPSDEFTRFLYLLLLCLPCLIFLSWVLQKMYDIFCEKLIFGESNSILQ